MKTSKLVVSLSLLLIVGIVTIAYALMTFTVTNHVNQPIGIVTVYTPSGNTNINVTGSGDFTGDIPDDVTGISIYNQGILQGTTGHVILQDGTHVKVTWTSSSIVVLDPDDIN
jgi:hypothetical protein